MQFCLEIFYRFIHHNITNEKTGKMLQLGDESLCIILEKDKLGVKAKNCWVVYIAEIALRVKIQL